MHKGTDFSRRRREKNSTNQLSSVWHSDGFVQRTGSSWVRRSCFCNNCHLYYDCDIFHLEAYEYYHYLVKSGTEKDRMFHYYEGDQYHHLTYPKETVIREPIYMDENGRKFQPVNCPRCSILMVLCGDGYSDLICEKCGLRYSPHITLERRYREFLEGFLEVGGMVTRSNITSSLEIKKLLSKLSKAQ